ncbi:MAG: ATP-binding protein [Leptospiraceae bacterium]|nr:ATP-binding protein [Leptospiraceae bacterium]
MDELKKYIKNLERDNSFLKDEVEAVQKSPFLPQTVAKLNYKVVLHRKIILENELRSRVNEKQGSLFEIKNQIRKYAPILGLDPDSIRIIVTEAIQNIIEHGHGDFAEVELDINNVIENPYFKITFKHEMPFGKKYTLSQIEENAKKGDISSPHFDFEDPRGRGEFLMKEISDERQIINGVDVDENGNKIQYFKRVLINYKNPNGPRVETSFDEIREELDRLDDDEVVCYFHLDHKMNKLNTITLVTNTHQETSSKKIMEDAGFNLINKDQYSITVFFTYKPNKEFTEEEINKLFAEVKKVVSAEIQHKIHEI